MAAFEATATTPASPAQVWTALVDIESWPQWLASYESLQRLDDGPLHVGSKARVKQPRLAASVWEVTALQDGREFTWQSTAAGVRTVATHHLETTPDGTRLRLAATQTGWLAPVVGALFGARIGRYLQLEADGITAAAERGAGPGV